MSLIIRKSLISLTGLFLCLFLVVHLSANLLLLLPPASAQTAYNAYSTFLRESPLVAVVAYLLYASIILHVAYAAAVTVRNRKTRPQRYAVNRPRENSTWASQTMGWLGVLIFIFLAVHLLNFWSRIKLGLGAPVGLGPNGHLDVYSVTYELFQNPYYVAFYALLMLPLGFHLHHGLTSAFKSLGLHSKRGLGMLSKIAPAYALIMVVGFGVIPMVVYLR